MGKIMQLPCASVIVPEVRITAVYDEELTQQLHQSLQDVGQVQPIVVVLTDGRYYLVDGLHRLREAQTRGDKTIGAVVYEGDPADVLLKNIITNRMRGKTKASEMVKVIQSLWKEYKLDSDQICARTGFSREYVEKLQKVSEACPEVQEALDAEIIGVGAAFEISRLPNHISQSELVSRAAIWKLTVKQLKEYVDQVLHFVEDIKNNPPAPAPPGPPPVYTCDVCKGQQNPRDLRSIQICPGCYSLAWQAAKPGKPAVSPGAAAPDPST
jgi:ParB/RepB/Spo0J family partition protein